MRYYQPKDNLDSAPYWANALKAHIPASSIAYVAQLMRNVEVDFHLSKPRSTKLGHYRAPYKGQPQSVSINSDLSPERFLLTLIHELAHLFTYQEYGRKVKPHGGEWKRCFQQLMTPLLSPVVFSEEILPHLIRHLNNPKATSCVDRELHKRFEAMEGKSNVCLDELPEGAEFKLEGGRTFVKGKKRRTRYMCYELPGRRAYLIHESASIARQKPLLSPHIKTG